MVSQAYTTPNQKVKNMRSELLKKLEGVGLLSEQELNLGSVPTGNYALNWVVSGDYKKGGIPIGMITQLYGESSTAKTVFATHILKEAQELGYYTMLVDSENAFNSDFASSLGIDPENLLYSAPETLEACFDAIKRTIMEIRSFDEDKPIVIVYDSIAVSPSKVEYEAEDFDGNNMQGAIRAKVAGSCLRKINPLLRLKKVALVIVNQVRSKVGVLYGDPTTTAGGGKALEYYLGVNLKTTAAKSERILDSNKEIIGIRGKISNTKNKVSIPFRSCEFELLYDQGLNPLHGFLPVLLSTGVVTQNGAWYSFGDTKFQKKDFEESFLTDDKFSSLRDKLGF